MNEKEWGQFKRTIGLIVISCVLKFTLLGLQEEKREKGANNICDDIVAENFSNLGKEKDIQTRETQRIANRINSERIAPKHTAIIMAKIKDQENLQSSKGKASYRQGNSIRLSADFSAETLRARREWHDILKEMRRKYNQEHYPARLSLVFNVLRTRKSLKRSAPSKQLYKECVRDCSKQRKKRPTPEAWKLL